MDWSPPGSSVHGILQARILTGWQFPSPGHLSDPGIEPRSPALAGRFFTVGAPRETQGNVLSVICTVVLHTPVITSNNSTPWEHKDTVVLTCGPETQNTSYMWWISNQSLPKSTRLKLSEDKRTLTVVTVTRKEKGPYVCETRNLVSFSRSDPFTLDVLYE